MSDKFIKTIQFAASEHFLKENWAIVITKFADLFIETGACTNVSRRTPEGHSKEGSLMGRNC